MKRTWCDGPAQVLTKTVARGANRKKQHCVREQPPRLVGPTFHSTKHESSLVHIPSSQTSQPYKQQQKTIITMNQSLLRLATTTLQQWDKQDLPLPAEMVLDSDDDNWNNADHDEESATFLVTPQQHRHSSHPSLHRHVQFDDRLQVHQVARVTPQEHDLYWYNDKDYLAMQRDAGVVLPFYSSCAQQQDDKRSCFRTAAWIERGLWLGTLLMGFLVTESLSRDASHRSHR